MLAIKLLRKLFYVLIVITLMSSCSNIEGDADADRRDDDREGSPEDIVNDVEKELKGLLDKCKEEDGELDTTPGNSVDIILDAVGLPTNVNPLRVFRICLKHRLQKGNDAICTAKAELIRRKKKARDETTKQRIDTQIDRLDRNQESYTDKLWKLANETDDRVKRVQDKDSGSILRDIEEEELEAIVDLLDDESYVTCDFDSDDED